MYSYGVLLSDIIVLVSGKEKRHVEDSVSLEGLAVCNISKKQAQLIGASCKYFEIGFQNS